MTDKEKMIEDWINSAGCCTSSNKYLARQKLRSKIQDMQKGAREPETVEALNSVLKKMDELGL